MAQIASFYLLKDGRRQDLFDGNCSGTVYMAAALPSGIGAGRCCSAV